MKNTNISFGSTGETFASDYLQQKGYKIIERNYKIRYGEIDIIAVFKNTLVFVEVKTRSSNDFGTALEAITLWKLRSVIKTAQYYKLTHKNLPELLRIDAVAVTILPWGEVGEIEHVENITS